VIGNVEHIRPKLWPARRSDTHPSEFLSFPPGFHRSITLQARFLLCGTNYSCGMKSLDWLEVLQVPWSHLDGAGSLKGHEMTPWVKLHSYIMAVSASPGGLGSFRPHKVTPSVLGH
jgi:hypothetical protein